jgi:para-aminobenzoate synthetase
VSGHDGVRVVLVDNYDSFTWNLYQQIWALVGAPPDVVRNDAADAGDLVAQGFTHVVISPGPGTPHRATDIGLCADLIRLADVPVLGVCLGHQAIAQVFGGSVVPAPEVMHGRISTIHHDGAGIFRGVPQGFSATRYHSLAVAEPLPPDLQVTARADDGVVMALEHRDRPLYGVQFHPESVATPAGTGIVRNFLALPGRPPRDVVRLSPPAQRPALTPRPLPVHVRHIDLDTPLDVVFERVFAASPYSVWLDSARPAYGMGRYSYLAEVDAGRDTLVRYSAADNRLTIRRAGRVETRTQDLFDFLRAELAASAVPAGAGPTPFCGGYIGHVGYGVKARTGHGAARPDPSGTPDAELVRVTRFLAVDHEQQDAWLVHVGGSADEADRWFDELAARLRSVPREPAIRRSGAPVGPATPSVDARTYAQHFDEIQHWLAAGESYEACYTYQVDVDCRVDPVQTYLRLRGANPAPYAAFLRFDDRAVLSSSPERFLTVSADGWAETKPIKGTAPRDDDPALDAARIEHLRGDEKNRSENLMIVDLLRNDLGRVCLPGTVQVSSLMAVESYATVHQLVSTVRGRLRADCTGVDALRSLFPGGSMTGAPKKRTVELLDALEAAPRGVYAGCLGFLSFTGAVDQSIVIRTMAWRPDGITIGTGGAITALSTMEDEYAETQVKIRALLDCLGLCSTALAPLARA